MNERKLRWGILGTANIARKNWRAIGLAGNATLTAVASRNANRARRFVAECMSASPFPKPPKAFGTYDELIASPDVDAVYLPLPTTLRHDWVLRAAAAGKHVLCEKPCARNATELQSMLDACRRHNVLFTDGVMFVHSARFARLLETVGDGVSIGDVRRIASQFSFRAEPDFAATNIRGQSDLEPLGCLGDLGWYCLRFALEVLGGRMPRKVTGRCLGEMRSPTATAAVPSEFSGELLFDDGVSAGFYCSFLTENQQWASVSGSLGHLHIADFVLPFAGDELGFDVVQPAYHVHGCDFRMVPNARRIAVRESSHGAPNAQEANLFQTFSQQVLDSRPQPASTEMPLKTQIVLDACLASASRAGETVQMSD